MGLDISGCYSEKTYHSGYDGLHQIRVLSLISMGLDDQITAKEIQQYISKYVYRGNLDKNMIKRILLKKKMYGDFLGTNKPVFTFEKELKPFWQLLHFSDCEGILIPDFYLKGIDYSKSDHLGSLTRLDKELEVLKDWIARTEKVVYGREKKLFFILYDLIHEEAEHGGMITFA